MTPVIPAPEPRVGRRSHPNALCYTSFDMELFLTSSPSTIFRWAEQGEIPAEKVGSKWIFPKNKVDPFLRRKGIIP